MKNKVLFFFQASNTVGLYFSLADKLRNENFDVVFVNTSAYLGSEHTDEHCVASINERKFHYLQIPPDNFKRTTATDIETLEKIFVDTTIKLVVVPYEFNFYYFVVNLARLHKIKTLHIQHGLWGPGKFLTGYNRTEEPAQHAPDDLSKGNKKRRKEKRRGVFARLKNLFAQKEAVQAVSPANSFTPEIQSIINAQSEDRKKGVLFPLTADFIAVPSEYYKQIVLDEVPGYSESAILVCGYLRNDLMLGDNTDIADFFGLPKGKNIVSYFYSPFYLTGQRFTEKYDSLQALDDFIDTCNRHIENTFFLILMHPTGIKEIPRLKDFLQLKGRSNFFVTLSKDKQGAIYKQSCLIGGAKTAALTEAALFTHRIIRQNYVLGGLQEPFQLDFNCLFTVSHPKHLDMIIKKTLAADADTHSDGIRYVIGDTNKHCGNTLYELLVKQVQLSGSA